MKKHVFITALVLLSSGCASLIPPSDQEMASMPVVNFGDPAPADGRYVLHYPKGTDLPVNVKIDGSLMDQNVQTELHARVKQDVWIYGKFASLDGQHWLPSNKIIEGKFIITPPGFGPKGMDPTAKGEMSATFNLR